MKTPAQRLGLALELQIGLEARELAAVAVALDLEVDETEMGAVEQDHPRARAEHGGREAPDRLLQAVEPHQAHDRRRLTAGDHESVEPVELLRQPHLDHLGAERAQHRRVLAKVALHCEDADRHDSNCRFRLRSRRRAVGANRPPTRPRAKIRSPATT